ncbi:MAG: LicD family protein [Ruminococcus sp.]|jgi:lipopolysaccharide cholinephosphotransferase
MRKYTQEELEKIQALSMETLKEFIRICEKYGLDYFAISGTAIGAVRHRGFIPWDDDMDVGMLREDYDRFLQVAPRELKGRYELYSASLQKRVQGFYLQMFPKGSVFMTRRNARWPLHPGIKLDIFPYDSVPAEGRRRAGLYRRLRFWNRLYIIKNTKIPQLDGKGWKTKLAKILCFLSYYLLKIGPSVNFIVKQYEKGMRSFQGQSDYYTILDDMNPDLWVIRKSELYPMQEGTFGTLTIKLPAKNHEMLLRQYGDYMKFPPEEERGGHDIVKLVFPERQEGMGHDVS